MPGATETDFFNKADMLDAKNILDGKLADAADIAKDGYDALMKGDNMVISGFKNRNAGCHEQYYSWWVDSRKCTQTTGAQKWTIVSSTINQQTKIIKAAVIRSVKVLEGCMSAVRRGGIVSVLGVPDHLW